MKVKDVMTSPVITIGPDATFADTVEQLLVHDISGVPVAHPDGTLLGIVTEADLVSKEAYGYRRRRALGLLVDLFRGRDPQWVRKCAGLTAREVMTAAPLTASPDEELAVAARRMLETKHKRLPVVENGRIVGMLSRHDLLRAYDRDDEEIARDVKVLLADPLRVPETHHAEATVAHGVVSLFGTVQWPSDRPLLEAIVANVPGVVAVDNQLHAREAAPRSSGPSIPPIYWTYR